MSNKSKQDIEELWEKLRKPKILIDETDGMNETIENVPEREYRYPEERIRNIRDDGTYRNEVSKYINREMYDEFRYPKRIDNDIYEKLARTESDYRIISQIKRERENWRDTEEIWEVYFLEMERLVISTISDLEKSKKSHKDMSITQFYACCQNEIINQEEKALAKYAVSMLLNKYPQLENVRRTEYRIKRLSEDNKFIIKPNKPFYEKYDDNKLKKFLTESNKVYLNPDMCFIPFKYRKGEYLYLLVLDNVTERIEEYRLKSFHYLNKQNNLRYIIEVNLDDRFLEEINQFERYLLKSLKKFLNNNMEIFYEVFGGKTDFERIKKIIKMYPQ